MYCTFDAITDSGYSQAGETASIATASLPIKYQVFIYIKVYSQLPLSPQYLCINLTPFTVNTLAVKSLCITADVSGGREVGGKRRWQYDGDELMTNSHVQCTRDSSERDLLLVLRLTLFNSRGVVRIAILSVMRNLYLFY